MNVVTRSWVRKAERDYKVACKLGKDWTDCYGDAVCFHCQQSGEKYLKACLMHIAVPFARTHDLGLLLKLMVPSDAAWQQLDAACYALNKYAVDIRYPDVEATMQEALDAIQHATEIRRACRLALGFKT